MRNNLSCVIGFSFIFANIAVSLNPNIQKKNATFLNSLTDLQKAMYKLVKKERITLFTHGTILGVILGILILYWVRKKGNLLKGCCFMATVFLTQYFYYTLSPKNYSMVEVLKGRNQLHEWNNVYKAYQWNYHAGILLAIIGYFLLGYGF